MINKRNVLFAKLLKTQSSQDRQRFVLERRAVAHELKRSKNAWFQQKAGEVERAVRRSKGAYNGQRDIQRSRAGL